MGINVRYFFSLLFFVYSFQAVGALTCASFFELKTEKFKTLEDKKSLLYEVVKLTDNKPLKDVLAKAEADSQYSQQLDYFLQKLKIRNRMPLYKIELFMQKTMDRNNSFDNGYIKRLLANLRGTSEEKFKYHLKIRLNSIIAAEAIAEVLQIQGVKVRKNTLTQFRFFWNRSFSNVFSILGFTNPDYVSYTRFDTEAINLVKHLGFEAAYLTLKERHALKYGTVKVVNRMANFLAAGVIAMTMVGTAYYTYTTAQYSYLTYQAGKEIVRDVQDLEYSETYFLLSTATTDKAIYKLWAERVFHENRGRMPDVIKNESDNQDYIMYLHEVSADWKAYQLLKTGRIPDFENNPQDQINFRAHIEMYESVQ